MKKVLSAVIAVTILIFSISFAGCSYDYDKSALYRRWYYMNTEAMLVVFDDFSVKENEERFNRFADEVNKTLFKIERSISATLSTSSVAAFNEAEAGATVTLDEHAYNVMKTACDMFELTDGYYNPAVYYSVRAYGFNGGGDSFPQSEDELPDDTEISTYVELSEHFADLKIDVDDDGGYYAVKPDFTVNINGEDLSLKLDLGGVGKGYAADVVNGLFDKYGFEKGYFNFGSSSLAFKKGEGGGETVLALKDPRNQTSQYMQLNVSDKCVSTSGDYENYYSIGDKRYCHIFNPKTGEPIQTNIMTATIIGGSAAENDALTTAIMAMGMENAVEFIKNKLPERQVVFTCAGGEGYKYYTNMQEGSFELVSSNYTPLAAGA